MKQISFGKPFLFFIVLMFLMAFSVKTGTGYPKDMGVVPAPGAEPGEDQEKGSDQEELRILSWNIYMLPYLHPFHNSLQRAGWIGEILNKSNYDIIVFQEAFHSPSREKLKNEISASFPYFYGPFNDPGFSVYTSSGVCIASRFPLRLLKTMRFNRSESFDVLAWKGAVLMEGSFRSRPFHLIATHMQSNEYPESRADQMRQMVLELVLPYQHQGITRMICGDLNVDSDNPREYSSMLRIFEATDDLAQLSGRVTYDERNNALARTSRPHARTLDYILLSGSPKPEAVKRKVTVFQTLLEGRRIELSDHYAIEAVIGYQALYNPHKDVHPGNQKQSAYAFVNDSYRTRGEQPSQLPR